MTGVSIAKFPGKGWLRRVPSGLKERNVPTEREKERRKVEARLGSARAKRHLKWLRFNTTHRNTSHAEFRRAVLTTPKVGPDRNGTDNRSSHMVGNEHHFPRSDPRILGAVEVCGRLAGPAHIPRVPTGFQESAMVDDRRLRATHGRSGQRRCVS